jgi:hypothetical protein
VNLMAESRRGVESAVPPTDPERQRLNQMKNEGVPWQRWGPYLAEREWGTVREDYSDNGEAWGYFTHDQARSRAYRWTEDGLLGISDDQGLLCFALALWNEADPILKERAFGLTNAEGNHGEDVKEAYFYLDSTPTHSYMKALYKYPQRAFPYAALLTENGRRDRSQPEFELVDTGIFDDGRYFDVMIEYAKAAPEDTVIRISVINRGPQAAPLHILPTLWFRNTWSWGRDDRQPELRAVQGPDGAETARWIQAHHHDLGDCFLACAGEPALLFTDNETNSARLWGVAGPSGYAKDGINDAVVVGVADAVNPGAVGTKAAAHYTFLVGAGETATVLLRLTADARPERPFADADAVLAQRHAEADAFYAPLAPPGTSDEIRSVQRQAFAGLLWSKQYYNFNVHHWLSGDTGQPPPPPTRRAGRNRSWSQFRARDVLVMPDAWEFPWLASWDLAFHCVTLSLIDPELAKQQLLTVVDDAYQHANGQVPAYEWEFSDVNPPVQAWAAWTVYQNEKRLTGAADREFLEEMLDRLLLNFTWWVNREDPEGRNVFQGGFLGLDNIGAFNRSAALPGGEELEQADGTAWMGVYCADLLAIALELARDDPAYENIASKFFEHFLYIAGSLNNLAETPLSLWDPVDEFYYDVLLLPDTAPLPLRVRSLVGLLPILAVEVIPPDLLQRLPRFARRVQSFLDERPDLADLVAQWHDPAGGDARLLALVPGDRLASLLRRMLDPGEFLSDHGIRSLSKTYAVEPYRIRVNGSESEIRYEPGESTSWLYGGNSNWRGPLWFPTSYLLIQALREFHSYYGDGFRAECPVGSGQQMTLAEIADELTRRLVGIFVRGPDGRRPSAESCAPLQTDPHWRDYVWFHEYFHGETGAGLGASHQTGWTSLVAALIGGGLGTEQRWPELAAESGVGAR